MVPTQELLRHIKGASDTPVAVEWGDWSTNSYIAEVKFNLSYDTFGTKLLDLWTDGDGIWHLQVRDLNQRYLKYCQTYAEPGSDTDIGSTYIGKFPMCNFDHGPMISPPVPCISPKIDTPELSGDIDNTRLVAFSDGVVVLAELVCKST